MANKGGQGVETSTFVSVQAHVIYLTLSNFSTLLFKFFLCYFIWGPPSLHIYSDLHMVTKYKVCVFFPQISIVYSTVVVFGLPPNILHGVINFSVATAMAPTIADILHVNMEVLKVVPKVGYDAARCSEI